VTVAETNTAPIKAMVHKMFAEMMELVSAILTALQKETYSSPLTVLEM